MQRRGISDRTAFSTGVDLSKILGGKTHILRGNVVKIDKYMGVSRFYDFFEGGAPGLPQSLRLWSPLKSFPRFMFLGELPYRELPACGFHAFARQTRCIDVVLRS